MIVGKPKQIAVTYEILARQPDSHFVFGTFCLYIDDKLIVGDGSDWTLNCLFEHFRKSKELTELKETEVQKEVQFNKACTSRGYLLHDSNQIDPTWWESDDPAIVEKVDLYLAEIDSMRTDPPFGNELPLYAELVDKNVKIFVFASKATERIIYSLDQGRTIAEKHVPQGTMKALIASLPETI